METVLSSVDLHKILPHRFPFIMIDKVVMLEHAPGKESRVGSKILCVKNVTINEPFFQGHFPDFPIMPGVMQLEAMAQASALAMYRSSDQEMDFFITGVHDSKFRRMIVPGDTLMISAEVVKDRGGQIVVSKCETKVDGQIAAEAMIMAAVAPKAKRKK